MAKSGGWRSYAYNCIFVVYTKQNQGNYFLSGNYQGISILDFCGHPDEQNFFFKCKQLRTQYTIPENQKNIQ